MATTRIRGAYQDKPTGEGAAIPYDARLKVAVDGLRMDWTEFMESLSSIKDKNSFYRILTEHLSIALINWSYQCLNLAVRKCPWDSGKLRSSGTVDFIIGSADTVMDNVISVQAGNDGTYDIRKHKNSIKTNASRIGCVIYFDRQDRGLDIALWAHEVLLPARNRPSNEERKKMGKKVWYAVNSGTGPKYLEDAFKQTTSTFHQEMTDAVQTAIKVYNRTHGQKVRRK